jgi:hypothetical protein
MKDKISKIGAFAVSMFASVELAHAGDPPPGCYPCQMATGSPGDDYWDTFNCNQQLGWGYYYCGDADPGWVWCCPG